jgi:TRAP-type mannitol/chloroaromatic compound transport system substrate-binding protein
MQVQPAGAIVPAYEEFWGINEGTLDWALWASTTISGELRFGSIIAHTAARIPPLQFNIFMEAVGYDLTNKWYGIKGYDVYDVTGFPGTPEVFMHSTKPLRTPDDYKGMNVRISGDAAEAFMRLGASTVFMPAGEIYEATMRGVIDAFEMSSPSINLEFAYHEVAKYIYLSPVRAPTEHIPLGVKRSKWETLPDDLKLIVKELGRSEGIRYHTTLVLREKEAIQAFKDYGNVVEPLPKEIEDAFKKEFDKWMDEIAADYPEFKEFLDAERDWAVMWYDLYGLPDWAVPPDEWRH